MYINFKTYLLYVFYSVLMLTFGQILDKYFFDLCILITLNIRKHVLSAKLCFRINNSFCTSRHCTKISSISPQTIREASL